MRLRQLIVASLLTLFAQTSSSEELSKTTRNNLLGGVVLLSAIDYNTMQTFPLGSGSVISKDGWILTNFHVVYDYDTRVPFQDIEVSFTVDPKASPKPICLANPKEGISDHDLDLALIRCDRDATGKKLSSSISYTPVPLGDSDAVDIGDEISIIGYPGIGGETINFTSGKISGFIGEDGKVAGDRWFKTEAALAPGNSGGAAVNRKGELVGIPTMIIFNDKSRVNLLRPIKYALPFLEKALGGKGKTTNSLSKTSKSGVKVIGRLTSPEGGPVSNGIILFLNPGVRIRDITESNINQKLYTKATSNENGDFSTELPLEYGKSFAVIIKADNFALIAVDDGLETGTDKQEIQYDIGNIALEPE